MDVWQPCHRINNQKIIRDHTEGERPHLIYTFIVPCVNVIAMFANRGPRDKVGHELTNCKICIKFM